MNKNNAAAAVATFVFSIAGMVSPALAQAAGDAPPAATRAPPATAPTAAPPASPAPAAQAAAPAPATSRWAAPASAVAANGEYVAPLSQTTQQTYVPQSVALSGPRMIKDWQDGDPIVYGYHPETRVRKGAIIGGALALGVPYLSSAFIASIGADVAGASGSNKAADLYIPVFEPFAELSQTDSSSARFMLVLDGLAQTVGAAMLIYGIASPMPVLVRNDLATVAVMPLRMGQDGNGVGVVGRF